MADFPDSFELGQIGTFRHDPSTWDGYYLGPSLFCDFLGEEIAFALDGPLEGRASELAAESMANFLAAGDALRSEVVPYLMLYYGSVRDSFSDEDCADYGIPLDVTESNVWEHVSLHHPPIVGPSLDDRNGLLHSGVAYIDFEGSCTWEEEHGLQLVFLHGERLIKVSPYDGHPTNAHACSNPAMLEVIFKQ